MKTIVSSANNTLPSLNKTITLWSIGMTALMFGLEISSVPVILPSLERILKSNFSQLQWIMNAYTIACTTVLMATGSLADRYGRKRLYLISISLFGLTSLGCGLAGSVPLLIAMRFLQGLGGGAMLICQIAVLSQAFREGRARAMAFGIWGIVFGVGLGFGPMIGGLILTVASWKWIFLIHVPISCLALALVVTGVAESKDPDAKGLDLPGIIFLSLAVFGLTFYITQGSGGGFTSKTGIVLIAAAAVCFGLFLWTERVSPHPMFDFSVFRIRPFSGALLGSMGMNFSFWPFMIYFPLYFQHALGYGVAATGASLLAYTLPTLLVPPLAERLALRYRPGVVIPSGMFTIGLGFFVMSYGVGVATASWLTVLPGAVLAGTGLGLTNTPVTNTTTSSIPVAQAGMASGIDMSARLISLAVNIAIMGAVLVGGIYVELRAARPEASLVLTGEPNAASLHSLAEKIASGSVESGRSTGAAATSALAQQTVRPALVQQRVRPALVHGFEWVMLYAGIAVWVLAGLSFVVFGRGIIPDNAFIPSDG